MDYTTKKEKVQKLLDGQRVFELDDYSLRFAADSTYRYYNSEGEFSHKFTREEFIEWLDRVQKEDDKEQERINSERIWLEGFKDGL